MRLILATACVLVLACTKKDDASSVASASANVSVAAPIVDAAPKDSNAWSGTYTAVVSTLYVTAATRDAGLKFRGEDAGSGLGEGTMNLAADPITHQVTGDLDGPLGALVINGTRDKDDVTFSLRPKTPSDESYFGTGDAKLDHGKLVGTIHVSRARANVIRQATFSLDGK